MYFDAQRFVLGLTLNCLVFATMSENTSELEVLRGNTQFVTNLYKVLSETPGNVVFSPISVHAVLSMAYQGALGSTAQSFASTLKVSKPEKAAEGYNSIMNRLNSIDNVTLLMANKVFVMEKAKILTDFSNAITKKFLSEVQVLNFAKNVEAAKIINSWVEEKTKEKIKELIQESDLNEDTRLVLVNAIYFKGNWLHQFDKKDTKVEPFYLNDVDKIDVDMMHLKKKFNYKDDEGLKAQVLELPYINPDLSMIIILPYERNGIAELEKKLSTYDLGQLTKDMHKVEVNVSLPRFKVEKTIDLEEYLTKLGLGEIFDPRKANFRGMIELSPQENLYCSKAVQKVFIEVNEEGAEAAAATGYIGSVLRCAPHLYEFRADHPFIFLLDLLFAGRVLNPNFEHLQ